MPIAAAIASVVGAGLQSSAANKAAQAQAKASADNIAFENKVYDQANNQLNPTINQGTAAGGELAGLENIGGNPALADQAFKKYLDSTNYKFQLGQGENAIGFANAPALQSSATAKALNDYAQGQAGSALGAYEGLLTGQQTLGANSALGLAGVGNQNAALQAQQNNLAAGAKGTAGLVGAGAWSNALGSLGSLISQNVTQSSFGSAAGAGAGGSVGSALGSLGAFA